MILLNESGFQVAWLEGAVHAPAASLTFIVKGTFDLETGKPSAKQLPLTGDEPAPEEAPVPPRYPSDFAPFKPRADLLVVGHARSATPVSELRVAFEVGRYRKELTVVGREPFTKTALTWENAAHGKNNPVGRDLPSVLGSAGSNEPAGFAPLCLLWPPRLSKVGTYDKKWIQKRWPNFPEDFDWGFFNAAPEDQQLPAYLAGDERIAFTNLHPQQPRLETALPGLRVSCHFAARRGSGFRLREVPMNLDTLWADLDEGRLVLVWRGVMDGKGSKEDLVHVAADPIGAPKPDVRARIEKMLAAAAIPEEPAPKRPPRKEPPPPKPDLKAKSFQGAILPKADFRGAKLAGRDFSRAALAGADFTGADLREADFTKADLDSAKLGGADLRGAKMAGVVATGASFRKAKMAGLVAPKGIFERAQLSGADLEGADLVAAELSGALLHEANLTGAKLAGANLERAWGEKLVAEGADFTKAGAADAVLVGANLRRIQGAGSVWERAHLHRADLSASDLTKAEFEGAVLTEAKLAKADLTEARLPKADLRGAELLRANLLHAVLTEANLSNADLRQSNCFESDLHKAVTEGARLDGANVERTWLVMK